MDSSHTHRPRTTRALANRAAAVVKEMGEEPASFHDSVQVLVAYCEIVIGETPPCPYCAQDTLRQRDGVTSYKCTDPDCDSPSYIRWYQTLGFESEPEGLSHPTGTKRTESRQRHRSDSSTFR